VINCILGVLAFKCSSLRERFSVSVSGNVSTLFTSSRTCPCSSLGDVLRAGRARTHQLYSVLVFSCSRLPRTLPCFRPRERAMLTRSMWAWLTRSRDCSQPTISLWVSVPTIILLRVLVSSCSSRLPCTGESRSKIPVRILNNILLAG